ncbi:toxin-antitoxin system YwqK family antitoxin [Pinibacter soli]|uniref:MORN repeat variant n=1 Tax=Pinibacter soli TaxID=3044211 RepID=A0ABT6RBB8_9BACT|nr:hypothetical protein [Pinibacter soli]MDI3319850.1 hypothetical protein [Pinibacter soli]
MKIILTLIASIVIVAAFSQTKDRLVETFYPDGTLKERGYTNTEGLKNGVFMYYAEDGFLDSSITFKNGKLNGPKNVYSVNHAMFTSEFFNGRLVSQTVFDSLNNITFKYPLQLKDKPKTTYHFASGRNYYEKGTADTLTISNGVPYGNQFVNFPGARVRPIKNFSWEILSWNPQPDSSMGKMIVDIYEISIDIPEAPSKGSKTRSREVILIPVK